MPTYTKKTILFAGLIVAGLYALHLIISFFLPVSWVSGQEWISWVTRIGDTAYLLSLLGLSVTIAAFFGVHQPSKDRKFAWIRPGVTALGSVFVWFIVADFIEQATSVLRHPSQTWSIWESTQMAILTYTLPAIAISAIFFTLSWITYERRYRTSSNSVYTK